MKRSLSLDYVKGMLDTFAVLNSYTNNCCDFYIEEIKWFGNTNVEDSLKHYFAGLRTSREGPFPMEEWQVQLKQLPGLDAYPLLLISGLISVLRYH